MSFQQLTSNVLVGSMSSQQLSLALNSYGVAYPGAAASDATSLGTVKAYQSTAGDPAKAKVRVITRSDGVYGTGESTAYILRYMDDTGTDVDQAIGTATLTNVTGAGEFEITDALINQIPVGAVLQLVRTYTAGTPNDPATAVTVELF